MSVMSAGTEARPSRWRAGLGRLAAGAALLPSFRMGPRGRVMYRLEALDAWVREQEQADSRSNPALFISFEKEFHLAGYIEDRWLKKRPNPKTGKRERTAMYGKCTRYRVKGIPGVKDRSFDALQDAQSPPWPGPA